MAGRRAQATELAINRVLRGESVRSSALSEGVDPSTLFRALKSVRVVIIGAGALGREMLGWVQQATRHFDVVFVDDMAVSAPAPIIGRALDFRPAATDRVFVAVAEPGIRHCISEALAKRGLRELPTFAHHTVVWGNSPMPSGALLFPYSLCSDRTRIGVGLVLNTFSSIGHDCVIGDFCTLSSYVGLCGHVKVGNGVMFGIGAKVLPGLKIGDGAVIGAGAVVVKDVPAGATVFGNPAKVIA